MTNHVIIKSNPHGLNINLDPDIPFETLLSEAETKFRSTAGFFRHAQIALSFSGRALTDEQERELTDVIVQNSGLQVVCLMDEDGNRIEKYRSARDSALSAIANEEAFLYYGDVEKGKPMEKLSSIVIAGNVPPGAVVKSCGNIVILGSCLGSVWAGCGGNTSCFISASDLRPHQLQIASRTARSAISRRQAEVDYEVNPQIAFLDEEAHIVIRPMNRKGITDCLRGITEYQANTIKEA